MATHAKAKASSRKSGKPRKTAKSPRRRNPVPQLPSPIKPGAQKLVRRSSGQLQPPSPSRPDQDSMTQILENLHPQLLGNLSYCFLSKAMSLTGEPLEAAGPGAMNFAGQMQPKDPLEGLALTQALLADARSAWLAKLATTQRDAHALGIILQACEAASGTFVKLMRAIAEYRRPDGSTTTVSIGQANVAHQQVIQNIQKQELQEKNDDERTKITRREPAVTAEILSANSERAQVTASRHPTNTTMDEKHGPENAGRKGPSQHECPKTRRALRGGRCPQATDEDNDSKTARPRGGPQRTMKTRVSKKSRLGGRKPIKK